MNMVECPECGQRWKSDLPIWCPDCNVKMLPVVVSLTTEKDAGAEVPLDRVVSQTVQFGKSYQQFCDFKQQIQKGYKPVIYGDDYAVMDLETYKIAVAALNKEKVG